MALMARTISLAIFALLSGSASAFVHVPAGTSQTMPGMRLRASTASRVAGPRPACPARRHKIGVWMGQQGAALGGDAWAGKLWEGTPKKAAHSATVAWVKKMVIGLDLCPFALDSMPGLKVVVADVSGRFDALDLVEDELVLLAGIDTATAATTLIVFPPLLFKQMREEGGGSEQYEDELPEELANFESFLDFVQEANGIAERLAEDGQPGGEALLLTFHPDSTFSDVPNDPAEFALRSPFPVVHLLRSCDVESAEEACEKQGRTTEDIALQNEARLRGEGYRELSKMLQDIIANSLK